MQISHLLISTGRSEAVRRLLEMSDDVVLDRLWPCYFVEDSFPDETARAAWQFVNEQGHTWDRDDPEMDLICQAIRAELATDIDVVCEYRVDERSYIDGEYMFGGVNGPTGREFWALASYLYDDDAEGWVELVNPICRLNVLRLFQREPEVRPAQRRAPTIGTGSDPSGYIIRPSPDSSATRSWNDVATTATYTMSTDGRVQIVPEAPSQPRRIRSRSYARNDEAIFAEDPVLRSARPDEIQRITDAWLAEERRRESAPVPEEPDPAPPSGYARYTQAVETIGNSLRSAVDSITGLRVSLEETDPIPFDDLDDDDESEFPENDTPEEVW